MIYKPFYNALYTYNYLRCLFMTYGPFGITHIMLTTTFAIHVWHTVLFGWLILSLNLSLLFTYDIKSFWATNKCLHLPLMFACGCFGRRTICLQLTPMFAYAYSVCGYNYFRSSYITHDVVFGGTLYDYSSLFAYDILSVFVNAFCAYNLLYCLHITKTCLYNIDPLKPHFYIVKLGFTGVYIIFLISAQKHRLWVRVRTASPRRF